MPTPITAAEVRVQIGEGADALIDGGTLPFRAGSTLLDLTVDPAVVLREGPITREELADFFGGRIRRSGE
jgi:L-threonylcarbamoyladenylate synthase